MVAPPSADINSRMKQSAHDPTSERICGQGRPNAIARSGRVWRKSRLEVPELVLPMERTLSRPQVRGVSDCSSEKEQLVLRTATLSPRVRLGYFALSFSPQGIVYTWDSSAPTAWGIVDALRFYFHSQTRRGTTCLSSMVILKGSFYLYFFYNY